MDRLRELIDVLSNEKVQARTYYAKRDNICKICQNLPLPSRPPFLNSNMGYQPYVKTVRFIMVLGLIGLHDNNHLGFFIDNPILYILETFEHISKYLYFEPHGSFETLCSRKLFV